MPFIFRIYFAVGAAILNLRDVIRSKRQWLTACFVTIIMIL